MRTTLVLNEKLVEEAKKLAAESGQTLTSFIEHAVRDHLAAARRPRERIRCKTYRPKVRGLQPGVELDSTARTLDLLNEGQGGQPRTR